MLPLPSHVCRCGWLICSEIFSSMHSWRSHIVWTVSYTATSQTITARRLGLIPGMLGIGPKVLGVTPSMMGIGFSIDSQGGLHSGCKAGTHVCICVIKRVLHRSCMYDLKKYSTKKFSSTSQTSVPTATNCSGRQFVISNIQSRQWKYRHIHGHATVESELRLKFSF